MAFLTCAVYAEDDLSVSFKNEKLTFNSSPIIVNDRTLVQLRPIAEAMGLEIEFEVVTSQVILADNKTEVRFSVNSNVVTVNGVDSEMESPMLMKDNYTFVPIRALVEPFGYEISYNATSKTILVNLPKKEIKRPSENKENTNGNANSSNEKTDEILEEQKTKKDVDPDTIRTGSGKYPNTYYYQSQEEMLLENKGKGYCWVCSYAMLITDVLGKKVTPIEVALFNEENGYNGNYIAGHDMLVKKYGLKLVPALSEESQYYGGFNLGNRKETVIKAEDDESAMLAIKEALDNFPKGVIVRYDGYPHSMVAVSYDDENIYFNDPGVPNGEHITFENTCLKNYKLSDISSIQAISK